MVRSRPPRGITLFALDPVGRFTSLEGNDRVLISDPDPTGRTAFEIFGHVPELIDSLRLALAGHEHSASFEVAEHAYEGRFEPLGRNGGAIGVLLDVSDRREIEEALARLEERLVRAERMAVMGSLAGGIAHQINNALTSARLGLGRLISFEKSGRPLDDARMHRIEMLQEVRESMARVERITRELRTFSHLEDTAGICDLRAVLDSAIDLVAHEIRHRAHLVCDHGDAPLVRGGEAALRHVFLQLLLNAAQSIDEGSAADHEIRLSVRRDGGTATVEIADTGRGIPADRLPRIFDPFFRDGEGLGLGLAVCKETVAALGGSIHADSTPGRGTTMTVTLPTADRVALSPVPTGAPGRLRVLIIDDDRPVGAAVALELGDHDVVVAGSGREALEILRRDTGFDAVLCDLMMPELTGMDLYEWIRPIDPDLAERFVFMTGGAFTRRAERFLAEHAAPCLEKPFEADELRALIAAVATDPTRTPAHT